VRSASSTATTSGTSGTIGDREPTIPFTQDGLLAKGASIDAIGEFGARASKPFDGFKRFSGRSFTTIASIEASGCVNRSAHSGCGAPPEIAGDLVPRDGIEPDEHLEHRRTLLTWRPGARLLVYRITKSDARYASSAPRALARDRFDSSDRRAQM
jgi:hypothetical protein